MLFFQKYKKIIGKQKGQKIHRCSPPDICISYSEKRAPYAALGLSGSLTLEASLVMPLFIAAFVAMLYFLLVIQFQIHIQKALYNQALKTAGYAYYVNCTDLDNYSENFLEAEYIKASVIDEIGKEYLDNSLVINGSRGISLNLLEEIEDGILDVALTYKLKVPFDIFNLGNLSYTSRARCHTWIGSNTETKEWDKEIVYMTTNGSVYHLYKDCSYIHSDVQSCNSAELSNLRNSGGAKYYPCMLCTGDKVINNSTVYYTKYGTRYHINNMCSNLKSNIYSVEKEYAVKNYPLCSKCSERGEPDD